MKLFLIILLFSFNAKSQLIEFSQGDLINYSDIENNFNEINNYKENSLNLINTIPNKVEELNQELSEYNQIINWTHTGTFTNGTHHNVSWENNISSAGTYFCKINYRSAPAVGNGDVWDADFTAIINHTSSGKDNVRYTLAQTKTAHAFNGKDVFIHYLNVLNGAGRLQIRITGETASGRASIRCKKML